MSDISQIKLPDNTTYDINAKTVNGYTVGKDVPSSAVFTDQYVAQVSSATEDNDYRVLLSGTASDNTQTETVRKSAGLKFNPKYDAITIGYDRASGSAYGSCSFTQGSNIVASGQYSHGEGWWTIANHRSQHVFGEYNIADVSSATVSNRGNYIEIVGNGTDNARSNARTLDWSGNEVLAGNLTIGGQLTDKWGLQSIRPITLDAYNALSYAEQHNGTYYHLIDVNTVPSLDCNVSQTPTTADHDYRVLLSGSDNDTASVEGALKNTNLTYNPNSHTLKISQTSTSSGITTTYNTRMFGYGVELALYTGSTRQYAMGIRPEDIIYSGKWDGTNASLKTAISSLKQSLSNLIQYVLIQGTTSSSGALALPSAVVDGAILDMYYEGAGVNGFINRRDKNYLTCYDNNLNIKVNTAVKIHCYYTPISQS